MGGKINLCYDFQGWPCSIMNLKEILLALGFEESDGKLSISVDDEILDAYPRILEDDGMGYGVDECYIVEVDNSVYDDTIADEKVNVFNLFREKVVMEEVIEMRKEREEFEEKLKEFEKERNEPKDSNFEPKS
jgi:hypothetical protein